MCLYPHVLPLSCTLRDAVGRVQWRSIVRRGWELHHHGYCQHQGRPSTFKWGDIKILTLNRLFGKGEYINSPMDFCGLLQAVCSGSFRDSNVLHIFSLCVNTLGYLFSYNAFTLMLGWMIKNAAQNIRFPDWYFNLVCINLQSLWVLMREFASQYRVSKNLHSLGFLM